MDLLGDGGPLTQLMDQSRLNSNGKVSGWEKLISKRQWTNGRRDPFFADNGPVPPLAVFRNQPIHLGSSGYG